MRTTKLLADIFCDNMVIQRDTDFKVFGQAENGDEISVSINGITKNVSTTDGKWIAVFPAQAGSFDEVDMTVKSEKEEITVKNIVFGDVFLASGQSNMEFKMETCIEYQQTLEEKISQNIRFYTVPKKAYKEQVVEKTEKWQICQKDNIKYLSAVAYFFANKTVEFCDVPIGIINCSVGGTSLLCWISEEKSKSIDEVQDFLKPIYEEIENNPDEKYDALRHKFDVEFAAYLENPEDLDNPWPPPMGRKSELRPNGLYENMVSEIAPYTVKSALWYQGESDGEIGFAYLKMLHILMDLWRKDFDNDKMFFFIVQIPSYAYGGDDSEAVVQVRKAEYDISKQDPYCATVCAYDLGDKNDIHPVNKKELGDRLGFLAAKHLYGKDVIAQGPSIEKIEKTEMGYFLTFTDTAEKLYVKTGVIKGFMIEEKTQSYTVEPRLYKNGIIIENELIKNIDEVVAIKYAWKDFIDATVYNSRKLPLYPFKIHNSQFTIQN